MCINQGETMTDLDVFFGVLYQATDSEGTVSQVGNGLRRS